MLLIAELGPDLHLLKPESQPESLVCDRVLLCVEREGGGCEDYLLAGDRHLE